VFDRLGEWGGDLLAPVTGGISWIRQARMFHPRRRGLRRACAALPHASRIDGAGNVQAARSRQRTRAMSMAQLDCGANVNIGRQGRPRTSLMPQMRMLSMQTCGSTNPSG
jgi:hypothetical protein